MIQWKCWMKCGRGDCGALVSRGRSVILLDSRTAREVQRFSVMQLVCPQSCVRNSFAFVVRTRWCKRLASLAITSGDARPELERLKGIFLCVLKRWLVSSRMQCGLIAVVLTRIPVFVVSLCQSRSERSLNVVALGKTISSCLQSKRV